MGSNFIRYWLREHPRDRIINLNLLTYAGDRGSLADVEALAGPRYTFAQGDIGDTGFVSALLAHHHPDAIFNFAAESHNSRAIVDPGIFMRTNALGTQLLLDAARLAKTPRFHHISTCDVYGDLALDSDELFTEESPYRPRTPYNASKAAADLIVRAYHETFGIATTISNYANNYGPFQHPEKVIPLFTTNAFEGLPLPLYRQSQNRREWLHVDDHCRAIDLILQHGRIGETYKVGSGEERSVEEIADAVLGAAQAPVSLKSYVDDRPGHDRRYLLDHSKVATELGWRPRVGFADGLRETVAWYRAHPQWWRPKKAQHAAALNEAAWRTRTTG